MERTLQVLDYAVLVISGTDGVQAHTETLWQLLHRYQIPTFLFVNKMDLPGANREALRSALQSRLGAGCVDMAAPDWAEQAALCDEQLMEAYLAGKELPAAELNDLTYDRYVQDCADRRASACSVFQMTNSGFHAEITLDTANLVFFSVPYDDGFTATVNGREADILRVDEGLMAVLCPAGESTIDFVYQPDGIQLGKAVTRTAMFVFLIYTRGFAWDDRKKRKH